MTYKEKETFKAKTGKTNQTANHLIIISNYDHNFCTKLQSQIRQNKRHI